MASTYTGSPTGVQAPDSGPAPGHAQQVSIPAGTDAISIESISQWAKVNADYLSYVLKILQISLPTTSSNIPQLRMLDAAGNGRAVVDHNGFPGLGRISQLSDAWGIGPGATGSQWSTVGGTGSSVAVQSPLAASYNAPFLKFTPSSTSGAANYCLINSIPIVIANTAGMSLVLEFEFGLNAAGAGTTSNTSWFIGLASGTDPINDSNLITLKKVYNVANYQVCSASGGLQNISALGTPTAPTAGVFPTDRFRIEIQGSASAYGAYQAKFWINEVFVASIVAANLPGAIAQRLTFGCTNEGGAPAGSPLGYMGPVFCTWNRFASGPNL